MKLQDQSSFTGMVNPDWKIGIVHSLYYEEDVQQLVDSAVQELRHAGIADKNILITSVPGSFEIPLLGKSLIEEGRVDALIGLGIIVEGETHHARLVAEQSVRGMMDIQVQLGTPFAYEILYVDDLLKAKERLKKGKEAASTVLHCLAEIAKLKRNDQ